MNLENTYDKALRYMEDKQYKKALKTLLSIEKEKKGFVAIDIAVLYADIAEEKCGLYRKKERKWYKKAIEFHNCSANTNLAICYKQEGKIKKSKKYFKKAIACGDIDAALDLALVYLSEVKINKAKKYLEMVITGIPYETVTEYSVKKAKKLLKKIKLIRKSKRQ